MAQFQQYVEATGNAPDDSRWQEGRDNAPVVYTSWDEAMAFCDWLTERWCGQGWLLEGYHVTLSSEPEWEKAAKGGYEIPAPDEVVIASIAELAARHAAVTETPLILAANSTTRRRYPWGGKEDDEETMNFDMHIGSVSTVGAYPAGVSPYGCEELSGNVWEWTRSLFESYPYPEDTAGRHKREGPGRESRVLRGGSFISLRKSLRCAYRRNLAPDARNGRIGFRVVLSPLL